MTKKTKRRTGKIIRIMAASAACFAVVAGALAGKTDMDKSKAKDPLAVAFRQVDRMFTLQVRAEETKEPVLLAEGAPVPVSIRGDKKGSWVLGANDTQGGILDYCIGLPELFCEGDRIESITYSINRGAFQIVQPENEKSIIVNGLPYDGDLNTGSIGGDYDETRDGEPSRPYETVLYKSFTLDYARQSDAHTWINFCNVRPDSEEIISLLWGDDTSVEKFQSGVQKMLDDTVITCTVHYTDHTSQSANIQVDSRIMTRREAGDVLEQDMRPEDLEEQTVVITFELQP